MHGPQTGPQPSQAQPRFSTLHFKENVFGVTRFSSRVLLFLGTILIPSAKGLGRGWGYVGRWTHQC